MKWSIITHISLKKALKSNFDQFFAKTYAKLILLKKRNIYHKANSWWQVVTKSPRGLFGIFFFFKSYKILIYCKSIHFCICIIQNSSKNYPYSQISEKFPLKSQIFLHIYIVHIIYELGKVKKVQGNKIGITVYSWTLWQSSWV